MGGAEEARGAEDTGGAEEGGADDAGAVDDIGGVDDTGREARGTSSTTSHVPAKYPKEMKSPSQIIATKPSVSIVTTRSPWPFREKIDVRPSRGTESVLTK